jgi:AraC-like DNA-binding protein
MRWRSSGTRIPAIPVPSDGPSEYLRERLGDPITLDDLAAYAAFDKFHLCRAFRAQVGMPPHTYRTHLRISRAKELLQAACGRPTWRPSSASTTRRS